jgi:hypothetical protein
VVGEDAINYHCQSPFGAVTVIQTPKAQGCWTE